MSTTNQVTIWERIIHPEGKMPPRTARAILELSLPEHVREQMHELAQKNQAGELTDSELEELEEYRRAGRMLSLIKAKARLRLRKNRAS